MKRLVGPERAQAIEELRSIFEGRPITLMLAPEARAYMEARGFKVSRIEMRGRDLFVVFAGDTERLWATWETGRD